MTEERTHLCLTFLVQVLTEIFRLLSVSSVQFLPWLCKQCHLISVFLSDPPPPFPFWYVLQCLKTSSMPLLILLVCIMYPENRQFPSLSNCTQINTPEISKQLSVLLAVTCNWHGVVLCCAVFCCAVTLCLLAGSSASDLVIQCTPEGIRLQCYMKYYTEEMKTHWFHRYGHRTPWLPWVSRMCWKLSVFMIEEHCVTSPCLETWRLCLWHTGTARLRHLRRWGLEAPLKWPGCRSVSPLIRRRATTPSRSRTLLRPTPAPLTSPDKASTSSDKLHS